MEPLERAISDVLIPEFTGQTCTEAERNLLALPVRLGGLGLINPVENAAYEFNASTAITEPLVQQIVRQEHEIPDDDVIRSIQTNTRKAKEERLQTAQAEVKDALPSRTQRAVVLACERAPQAGSRLFP